MEMALANTEPGSQIMKCEYWDIKLMRMWKTQHFRISNKVGLILNQMLVVIATCKRICFCIGMGNDYWRHLNFY